MGTAASQHDTDTFGGLPSLDSLGGFYRPAVSRSTELDTKLSWLGRNVHDTAEEAEHMLDKHATKASAIANQGGPRTQIMVAAAFGRAAHMVNAVVNPAHGGHGGATGASHLSNVAGPGSSFGGHSPASDPSPSRPSFTNAGLTPAVVRPVRRPSLDTTGFGFGSSGGRSKEAPSMARQSLPAAPYLPSLAAPHTRRITADGTLTGRASSHAESAESAAGEALRNQPVSLPRPLNSRLLAKSESDDALARSLPRSPKGANGPSLPESPQSPNLRRTASQQVKGVASARATPSPAGMGASPELQHTSCGVTLQGARKTMRLTAPTADELHKLHWRHRVQRAKRRLYWYLKAYMAFSSVLRRKRVGYADSMPVEVLPAFLANSLGPQAAAFGKHLESSGQLVDYSVEARSKLAALGGGRKWLSVARARAVAETAVPAAGEAAGGDAAGAVPGSEATAPAAAAAAVAAPPPPSAIVFTAAPTSPVGQKGAAARKSLADVTPVLPTGAKAPAGSAKAQQKSSADVVSRLASLYMKKTAVTVNVIKKSTKDDLKTMLQVEEVDLTVLANRANAAWVEARGTWHPPQVLDMGALTSHVDLYRQLAPSLLEAGKIAVNFTYNGEEQVTGVDASGNELREPALMVDLWAALGKLFPHKVPQGQRIAGLSLLSRRILQAIVDVDHAVGHGGVDKLVVVLSIDSLYVDWVLAQLLLYRHYCLHPEQILIVSIARFPGSHYDSGSSVFKLNYDTGIMYQPAGTGYSFLAMSWASAVFWLDPVGERQYLPGSCLSWLQCHHVDYIHSTPLVDCHQLVANGPSVTDVNFLAPALFAFDHRGAGMAMETVRAANDVLVRQQGNLVMSPIAAEPFSCAISNADLQSSVTRAIVFTQGKAPVTAHNKGGNYVSCTHRYLYNVKHLHALVKGPSIFRPDTSSANGCAYLTFEQTDLTSVTEGVQSKCVAVLGRHPGPDVRLKVHGKEWLREFGHTLSAQDQQPAFRSLVSRSATKASAAVSVSSTSNPMDHGIKMLLYVVDNAASRHAFRLARGLMRSGSDKLELVHLAHSPTSVAMAMSDSEKLLATFHDVLLDGQITRRSIMQGDKVTQSILTDLEMYPPDLCIMGSEILSTASGTAGGAAVAASVVLAVARGLHDIPLLVVKNNPAGDFFAAPDESGVPAALHVLLEVSTAATAAAAFITARLQPGNGRTVPTGVDKLFLGRPYGLDKNDKETSQSSRIIASFLNDACLRRVAAVARPTSASIVESFPHLVVQDKIDLLVLPAPSSNATPPSVVDLLRTARCAVLVHRVHSTASHF